MEDKSLEELRKKIDQLDRKLVNTLSQRMEVVDEILDLKKEAGREIRDRERELEVIERIRKLSKEKDLDSDFVEDIMRIVISRSAGIEKEKAGGPSMWKHVSEAFSGNPAQLKVARVLYKYGLRVGENGNVVCDGIRVPAVQIAKEAGVDRRAVNSTSETILENEDLKELFANLRPIPYLKAVAQHLNLGVIEILPPDAAREGIISEVTGVISKHGLSIRQSVAEDPFFTAQPKLTIIVDEPVSGEVIEELRELKSVDSVIVY